MNFFNKIYYINLQHRSDRREHMEKWFNETNIPKDKIERIDAIYETNNVLAANGCTKSHIKTLEYFLEYGVGDFCCVFEDDFMPNNKETFWNDIEKIFINNVDFDIIQLSYTIMSQYIDYKLILSNNIENFNVLDNNTYINMNKNYLINNLEKFKNNQFFVEGIIKDDTCPDFLIKPCYCVTSSSYIIHRKFVPKLIEHLKKSLELTNIYYENTGKLEQSYRLDIYWCRLMTDSKWFVYNPSLGHQIISNSDIDR